MKPEDAIKLAELCQESFLNRRNYEWKINFGLWSSIGVWTYFSLSNPVVTSNLSFCVLFIVYFVILLIYALLWQIPIRQAFEKDKLWKHYYMNLAERRGPDRPSDKRPNICGWNQMSYTVSQCSFTLALLAASFFLIYFSHPASPSTHEQIHSYTLPDSSYQVIINKLK